MIPALWTSAKLFDLALLGVAALDFLVMTRPRALELEREVPERMNLGTSEAVTVRARNRGRWALKMLIRDETPPECRVILPEGMAPPPTDDVLQPPPIAKLSVRVEPHREVSLTYRVLPERRGDWSFGALSARYLSPLGLWHRQFQREATRETKVYPDATLVRRYELRLRQGRVQEMGLHLLRLRGRGTEFESLRDYSRDDEFKNINWKASARRGKLIATNYEVERDQTVLIAVDCGRMMTAQARLRTERQRTVAGKIVPDNANAPDEPKAGEQGAGTEPRQNEAAQETSDAETAARNNHIALTGKREAADVPLALLDLPLSKLDCAINATVLLAHVAASMGDFVGLLLFDEGVLSYIPPRKGKAQVGRMVDALYNVQPRLVEPDYGAAYEYLLARRLRRALVVTFTDLIDPFASRELVAAAGALRKQHNALCVTLQDSDVLDLAATMPETPLQVHQKAMAARMLAEREAGLNELRKRGVSVLDVPASQLSVDTVNKYLDLKSRAAL